MNPASNSEGEPMTAPTKNAVIYARVSTEDQAREGTSLDTQVAACQAEADRLGYRVSRIVREQYSRTELFDRPLLTEVRDSIRAGQVDALLVYCVDRLSGDPIHVGLISQECDRW
jgi:site-specific DNA recombinase